MKPILQTGPSECGVAALEMIFQHFGLPVRRTTIRRRLGTSLHGVTAASLARVAREHGLDCDAFEVTPERLSFLSTLR